MEGSKFVIIVVYNDAQEAQALLRLAEQHSITCSTNGDRVFFFIPTATMLVLMSQYISELLE